MHLNVRMEKNNYKILFTTMIDDSLVQQIKIMSMIKFYYRYIHMTST